MFHLGAFYQSVDTAGGEVGINAVPDQALFTSGADLRVPDAVANLLGEAGASALTGPDFMRVSSPSLRELADQYVQPISPAASFGGPNLLQWHGDNPRALVGNESLNMSINATGGVAAANYGLVWLGDGPVKPTSGKMFTVLSNATETLTAGVWGNTALTLYSTLPFGTYQVVGMSARAAGVVAARLVFVGGQYRPGVPASNSQNAEDFITFRFGNVGVFGQFDTNQPPSIDILGTGAVTLEVLLDLIKVK